MNAMSRDIQFVLHQSCVCATKKRGNGKKGRKGKRKKKEKKEKKEKCKKEKIIG